MPNNLSHHYHLFNYSLTRHSYCELLQELGNPETNKIKPKDKAMAEQMIKTGKNSGTFGSIHRNDDEFHV